ncbi:PREDICTED: uncharacterized protein LOC104779586 isoform X1 [Camelina sativa]|uniref:Uncharacterized protein LOC104779586 isoform X1 n=1 Tax=Camelina sativa TaxID=90675 RepID=A0ABM1RLV7_CAMSA|nr:PREDICTED: uncharacterized protein LOC104779586 isoform X1 [Camelina sativa]XP_019099995.1 PREDICTED: uncharacterized protein LOC104779586 isoform X1 [Camelina sativa]
MSRVRSWVNRSVDVAITFLNQRSDYPRSDETRSRTVSYAIDDLRIQSQNHRESNQTLSITCCFSSYGKHLEFHSRGSGTAKPATSYRKKKAEKDELPDDSELYRDPTNTLYYTNQGLLDDAAPVLLVDGYNVCGYWMKLKKHFMKGRLDVARQKLVDESVSYIISSMAHLERVRAQRLYYCCICV